MMPPKEFTMPTTPARDYVRELILVEMKRKGVTVKAMIKGTGLSKNTIYEHLNGNRGMRSGNVSKILAYLKRRRTPAK